ncbi:MAG: zf-HC2 domain-containing protein [Myxococcales bacterium]|nr:zf-HC2 domain-containing protein [Myxococcales bacterium]
MLALIERLIDDEQRLAIEAHLDDCPRCRELVSAVAQALPGEASDKPYELEVGDIVAQRFRTIDGAENHELGQRYIVLDRRLAQRARLTVIDEQLERAARDAEATLDRLAEIQRGYHEAVSAAALPYAAGRHQGLLFMVERELRNVGLVLPPQRTPSLHTALYWLAPVAKALATLHQAGVVHGDIASAPLYLVRDRARLSGFAAAALKGSSHDAAPEETRQRDVEQLIGALQKLIGASDEAALPAAITAARSAAELSKAIHDERTAHFERDGATPYQDGPLDEAHADVFAGREPETTALREQLRAMGVIGVYGPAQSGKSSLLRAGLAAWAVRSASARALVVALDARPWARIVAALAPDHPASADDGAARELLLGDEAEAWLAQQLRAVDGEERTLLIVDQLEALLGDGDSDGGDDELARERAQRLVSSLIEAAEQANAMLALAGRDDPRIAGLLAQLPERALLRLDAVDPKAVERALRKPLAARGYNIDKELVQSVVERASAREAPLAAMSRAMRPLWLARDREAKLISAEAQPVAAESANADREAPLETPREARVETPRESAAQTREVDNPALEHEQAPSSTSMLWIGALLVALLVGIALYVAL